MRQVLLILLIGTLIIAPSFASYARKAQDAKALMEENDIKSIPDSNNDVTWDDFFEGKVPAFYKYSQEGFYYTDLSIVEFDSPDYDFESYWLGDMLDYDNDGEDEVWLHGIYGGMFLDIDQGVISVFEEGGGTAEEVSIVYYDSAYWIVHSDLTHVGRQTRYFKKYSGANNVVDEFELNAEYWDNENDWYDENSDFTYRGQKITKDQYETILFSIYE